jgi:hypothetical protein
MKVEMDIAIQATPEAIWSILSDFAAYPQWNPYIKAVRGQVAPEAVIEMDMLYNTAYDKEEGLRATEKVQVTAYAAPRYFSWVWTHPRGTWWLSSERVFRIKVREDGKCTFFHEAYFTGMSLMKLFGFLDFRRDAMEKKVKLSMVKMNDALKARAEKSA